MKFPCFALSSSRCTAVGTAASTIFHAVRPLCRGVRTREWRAVSIVCLSCVLLMGCDSLGLPNLTHHDEVPAEAKAVPRLVEVPPATTQDMAWPRLGDVPFKPKDFSTKPVYEHYIDELEFHRAEAEEAKKQAEEHTPVPEQESPQ